MAREATGAVHSADATHTASARAFLRKDYAVSLAETQRGLELLRSEATGTEPASAALERLLVLRITACTAACLDERVKKNVLERLQMLESSMPSSQAARELLDRSLPALVVALWYQCLACYGGESSNDVSRTGEVPESLKPTPEDLPRVLQLPTQVLAAVILMALRVDERTGISKEPGQSRPSSLSRQMCEWYFDALLTPEGKAAGALPPSYNKALSLYTVQVLGTLHREWDYAREVTGYSSLPDEGKWVCKPWRFIALTGAGPLGRDRCCPGTGPGTDGAGTGNCSAGQAALRAGQGAPDCGARGSPRRAAAACRAAHRRADVAAGTGGWATGKCAGRQCATFGHVAAPHAEHPEPSRAARRRHVRSCQWRRRGRRPGCGQQIQQLEPCFLKRALTRVPTSAPCRAAEPPSECTAARASPRRRRGRVAALIGGARVTAPDALDCRCTPAGASGGAAGTAARRWGACWRLPRRVAH